MFFKDVKEHQATATDTATNTETNFPKLVQKPIDNDPPGVYNLGHSRTSVLT